MYAAKIRIGWMSDWFKGETPREIIRNLEQYQDFSCLMRMGRANEGVEGQKELDKLEIFLNKFYSDSLTMNDIKNLNIHLNIGDIVCLDIIEGEENIRKLS